MVCAARWWPVSLCLLVLLLGCEPLEQSPGDDAASSSPAPCTTGFRRDIDGNCVAACKDDQDCAMDAACGPTGCHDLTLDSGSESIEARSDGSSQAAMSDGGSGAAADGGSEGATPDAGSEGATPDAGSETPTRDAEAGTPDGAADAATLPANENDANGPPVCDGNDAGPGCQAACVWGARRCVQGERGFDICQQDGTWGTPVACPGVTLESSWTVCRPSQGSVDCVDSSQVNNGFDEVSAWERKGLPANRWAVQPVIATRKLQVFSLNVFMGSVPEASSLQMALWEETSNAEGKSQPGTLLARTAIIVNPSPNDLNRLPVTTARPTLVVGKTYWVGVNVSQDSEVRSRASSGAVAYAESKASSQAPHPFPAATLEAGAELGVYLQGKDEL